MRGGPSWVQGDKYPLLAHHDIIHGLLCNVCAAAAAAAAAAGMCA